MEVQFSDISADVNPAQAVEFLTTWFEPGDLVNITCIRAVKSGSHNIVSQAEPLEELVRSIEEDPDSLKNVVWTPNSDIEWNVYYGVCPSKHKPKSIFRRGGLEVVDHVPGVWADIDIKEGGFSSQKEILEWVDTLACEPTMVIDSGSGGVHLYWKYDPTTIYRDESASEAWWAYLDFMAGTGKSIDKIQDLSRILRLPGTIRFAKHDDESSHSVRILSNSGSKYSQRDMRNFSESYYEKKKERMRENLDKEDELTMSIESLEFPSSVKTWGSSILKTALLEEKVMEEYSWESILSPMGWTINRRLRDGSIEWTRPGEGASGRSAVTDWEDSPHVMSLLSTDPHTGLSELKAIGTPLTKLRVMLRLWYSDDVEKMVKGVYNEETRKEV